MHTNPRRPSSGRTGGSLSLGSRCRRGLRDWPLAHPQAQHKPGTSCPIQAVKRAHRRLRRGSLSLASGQLLGANANRSPTAYTANPADERAGFQHDVDKDMTLLRFDAADTGK